MGLETGEFLDDLVQDNPITATDPVSEGSDHIRLLKKVLQQTFPNYTEAVILTAAELNDAALKSVPQIITGAWAWANTVPIFARDFADLADVELISLNAANEIQLGAAVGGSQTVMSASMRFDAGALIFKNNLNISGTPFNDVGTVRILRYNASDFWEIGQSSSAVLGHIHNSGADLSNHDFQVGANGSTVKIDKDGMTLQIARTLFGLDSGGQPQRLIQIAGDIVNIGSFNGSMRLDGVGRIEFRADTLISGRAVTPTDGGMVVSDRANALKKVGFRNPSIFTFSGARTLSQNDEGRVLQVTSNPSTLTIDQVIDEFMTCRVLVTGSGGDLSIVKGTIPTMRWLDGSGSLTTVTTGVTVVQGSVVELYFSSTDIVYVWGNGISEI